VGRVRLWVLILLLGAFPARADLLESMRAEYQAAGSPETRLSLGGKLAESLMMSGRTEEARTVLTDLMKKATDPHLTVLLARSYLAFPPTEPDEAIKILKVLLKANPKYVEGLMEWAAALIQSHDLDNALKTYDRVLYSNKREFAAIFGKVDILLRQKKFKEAEKLAQGALEMDAHRPDSHYWLGQVFDRRVDQAGGAARAAYHYQNAVELDKQGTRYYAPLLLVQILRNVGGYDRTLRDLKARAPGDASVAFAEGLLLDEDDSIGEAQAKFQGAVSVDYRLTWAHFALGLSYGGTSISRIMRRGVHLMARSKPKMKVEIDSRRCQQEFVVVRFQDPNFPMMHIVEQFLTGAQTEQAEVEMNEKIEQQQKAWQNYYQLLQQHN
jgi:tetratricopeptide (TPR) repeat protein